MGEISVSFMSYPFNFNALQPFKIITCPYWVWVMLLWQQLRLLGFSLDR